MAKKTKRSDGNERTGTKVLRFAVTTALLSSSAMGCGGPSPQVNVAPQQTPPAPPEEIADGDDSIYVTNPAPEPELPDELANPIPPPEPPPPVLNPIPEPMPTANPAPQPPPQPTVNPVPRPEEPEEDETVEVQRPRPPMPTVNPVPIR